MASVIMKAKRKMMNGDGTLVGEGRFDEVRIALTKLLLSGFATEKAWLADKDAASSLRFSDWRTHGYGADRFCAGKARSMESCRQENRRLFPGIPSSRSRFSEGLAKVRQKEVGIVEDSGRMKAPMPVR